MQVGSRHGCAAAVLASPCVRASARRYAVIVAVAAATLLAGCSTSRGGTPQSPPAADSAQRSNAGQQATLRAIGGSAVSGKIRVIDRGNGASVLVSVLNFPGGAYRIAFHERPNCSSPNGFSAGAAWAPASTGKRPEEILPPQYTNSESSQVESELRVPGLHATGVDGVAGRSVLLYAGTTVTEPRPDVPNAAVACGVFETVKPIF